MKRGLNVGSGQRPFKSDGDVEWINVDSVARWNPDLVCDGSHLPYDDNSVNFFVLHHVLEHFGCGEAKDLVKESYRVLRPDGSLIVCVPNMTALCRGWQDGKIDTQVFMTNLYGAYMGHEEDRHRWGYTVASLYEFLRASAPWGDIGMFDFRPISGADIAQDWWILGMEATRCIRY